MTVSQLHALYCAAYAEARGLSEGGVAGGAELEVDGAGLDALERLILEFALHDVTNGTPMRSPREFQRAVAQGADLLGGLGLRAEPDAAARSGHLLAPHVEVAWRRRIRRAPLPALRAG